MRQSRGGAAGGETRGHGGVLREVIEVRGGAEALAKEGDGRRATGLETSGRRRRGPGARQLAGQGVGQRRHGRRKQGAWLLCSARLQEARGGSGAAGQRCWRRGGRAAQQMRVPWEAISWARGSGARARAHHCVCVCVAAHREGDGVRWGSREGSWRGDLGRWRRCWDGADRMRVSGGDRG